MEKVGWAPEISADAKVYAEEYAKVVAAEAMTALAEKIHDELVCGCVEEFGETFVKGGHDLCCWYAHLAARLATEAATRFATT